MRPDINSPIDQAGTSPTLLSRIETLSTATARLTGTEIGHINPMRLAIFVGIVATATILAGNIPDHQIAMLVSDTLGALGGAFAGDNIRPISRWNKTNIDSLIADINSGQINEERLVRAFSTFKDTITDDEIKTRLLGRTPNSDQKPADDIRYRIIDALSTRYREENGEPKTKRERKTEREQIIATLTRIQELAYRQQTDPNITNGESLARIGDITSGIIIIGALAIAINFALKGEAQGGLVGLTDDLATFAITLGSIISKPSNQQSSVLSMNRGSALRNVSYPPIARRVNQDPRQTPPDQRRSIWQARSQRQG